MPDRRRADPEVTSIPLDSEDGPVVIEQQNAGPGRQVGGGEFKNARGRSVEEAGSEQAELERRAPIPMGPVSDPDAPGTQAAKPLSEQDDAEPNEPA